MCLRKTQDCPGFGYDRPMTVDQAALVLGCSGRTVRRAVNATEGRERLVAMRVAGELVILEESLADFMYRSTINLDTMSDEERAVVKAGCERLVRERYARIVRDDEASAGDAFDVAREAEVQTNIKEAKRKGSPNRR